MGLTQLALGHTHADKRRPPPNKRQQERQPKHRVTKDPRWVESAGRSTRSWNDAGGGDTRTDAAVPDAITVAVRRGGGVLGRRSVVGAVEKRHRVCEDGRFAVMGVKVWVVTIVC